MVTIVLGPLVTDMQVFVDNRQVGYLKSILLGVSTEPFAQSAAFKFVSSDLLKEEIQRHKDLLRKALPWATIE